MLSNKWTFSLTSLVVILALAFVVPSAMAEFGVTMGVGSGVDKSSAGNIQVEHGAATMINIKFDKVVDLDDAAYGEATAANQSGTKFGADDLLVIAYNEFGGTIALTCYPPKCCGSHRCRR